MLLSMRVDPGPGQVRCQPDEAGAAAPRPAVSAARAEHATCRETAMKLLPWRFHCKPAIPPRNPLLAFGLSWPLLREIRMGTRFPLVRPPRPRDGPRWPGTAGGTPHLALKDGAACEISGSITEEGAERLLFGLRQVPRPASRFQLNSRFADSKQLTARIGNRTLLPSILKRTQRSSETKKFRHNTRNK